MIFFYIKDPQAILAVTRITIHRNGAETRIDCRFDSPGGDDGWSLFRGPEDIATRLFNELYSYVRTSNLEPVKKLEIVNANNPNDINSPVRNNYRLFVIE